MSPDQFEKSLDSLSTWLSVFTGLVVLGLFIEYQDEIGEFISALYKRITGTSASINWPKFLPTIGGILVFLGVMGEFLIQGRISQFEGAFRADTETTLKTARDRLISAEKTLVSTDKVLLQTVKKLAPRTLTLEQQARIVSKLKPFSNTPFDLSVDPEPEALVLLGTVDSILVSSGWINTSSQVKPGKFFFTLGDGHQATTLYISKVAIEVAPSRTAGLGMTASVLVSALQDEGIAAFSLTAPTEENAKAIHVIIGQKQ